MTTQKNGFTLIEMMIAIAIMAVIIGGLGQIIGTATRAYTINIENTEAMTKLSPVIRRIEYDLKNTVDLGGGNTTRPAVSGDITSGTDVVGIKITRGSTQNTYWWDKDGDGRNNGAEGVYNASNATAFYLTSGTSSSDAILISAGVMPATLTAKYGNDWQNVPIKIIDVKFRYYTVDQSTSRAAITTSAVNADYIKIYFKLTGTREGSSFEYNTGFKIR